MTAVPVEEDNAALVSQCLDQLQPAHEEDSVGQDDPGQSLDHNVNIAELKWNLREVPGHGVTTDHRGEQLQEGRDDDVGHTEAGQEAVVRLLQEVGAVLDGGHNDHVEDGGEDAETEVQRDKDSTSGEVAQSKHCWPRHCWSQERLKIVLTEQQL